MVILTFFSEATLAVGLAGVTGFDNSIGTGRKELIMLNKHSILTTKPSQNEIADLLLVHRQIIHAFNQKFNIPLQKWIGRQLQTVIVTLQQIQIK